MKKSILRTNLLISAVIIIGFLMVEISTEFSFTHLFMQDVEYVSNLTSENMYTNIKELMGLPINVSLAMAHDTFLRDYMIEENSDLQTQERLNTIKDYLTSYKDKNGFDSVFLVSCKTLNYYHYKNGVDRVLTKTNEEDTWYYDFLNSSDEYALNIDNDQASEDTITVFVNAKLKDEKGNVLGVVGVGLKTPYIQKLLANNENTYNISAYLIDDLGNIQISSELTEFQQVNLFSNPTYSEIKENIIENKVSTENKWYTVGNTKGYLVTRYIPYLNWYLIVEKNTDELYHKMIEQLWINSILMLIVLAGVLSVTTIILKKNSRRITMLAEQDRITGLKNRTKYEQDMEQYAQDLKKYKSFGIGIFDLNDFKNVNDTYGHQEGDEYLKAFSVVLRESFRQSPVYRIGGDEFCIIILNLSESDIQSNYEALKCELKMRSESKKYPMSAAFGYAFYDEKLTKTPHLIFATADKNMYKNKNAYKSQIEKGTIENE